MSASPAERPRPTGPAGSRGPLRHSRWPSGYGRGVPQEAKNVSVDIPTDHAVVLYELLTRLGGLPSDAFADLAEQRVIWDLQSSVERQIPGIFSPGYKAIVEAARASVRDPEAGAG